MNEVVFENWTVGREDRAMTVAETLRRLEVYCLFKIAAKGRSARAFDMTSEPAI
jgi:hypothetical protein